MSNADELFILVLVAAPFVAAVVALSLAVVLFRRARKSSKPTIINIAAFLLALVGLAIVSCYGVYFLGS